MADFHLRKIKFKAWNQEARLLMRLNSIDCDKGELVKKGHILLQYTGLNDKEGNEIYDQDVLLIYSEKFLVMWNEEKNGWHYAAILKLDEQQPFLAVTAGKMKRFCSYFELDK